VPRAGRAEGTGGAERILQELDVTDLVTRHPREQSEGRGDLFAERARFVRKAPEHRDAVFIRDDVSNLERLCLPDLADAVEDVDDALRAPVRACPGEHLVQLGVVEVQRNIGDIAGGKTAHVIDVRGIREERLHQLKRGLHLNLQR